MFILKSKRLRKAAGRIMQAVFTEFEPTSVRAAYHAAIDAIAGFSEEAAESLEEAEADALAYLDFPVGHRRRILTCVKISDTEARGIRRP